MVLLLFSITGYGLSLVKMTGKAVLAKTAQALIPTKKHFPILIKFKLMIIGECFIIL